MEWLEDYKIPVGRLAAAGIDWITDTFQRPLDSFSDGVNWLIDQLLWLLQAPHPLVIIAVWVVMPYFKDWSPLARKIAAAVVILVAI